MPSPDPDLPEDAIARVADPREGFLLTTLVGFSGREKIVHYNFRKLINIPPLLTALFKGTVFNLDKSLMINMAKYLVLGAVSAIALLYGSDENGIESFTSNSMPNINAATDQISRFCPFLFGLFVSLSLSRWWTMRDNGIGNAADYMISLSSFLISNAVRRLPQEDDWKIFERVHARIVRYALASLSCVAKESRGDTASMDDLVRLNLVTEEEKTLLENVEAHNRGEALWCWISALSSEAMEMIQLPAPNFNMLYTHLRNATKGIHVIHQHLTTQLPFPYVHMITLLVNTHNCIVAVVAGLKFAVALHGERPAECAMQFMHLVIVPTMYQGLLQICMFLSDPFGEDIIDFPILEMQIEVSDVCKDMMRSTRRIYEDRWSEKRAPLPHADPIKLPERKRLRKCEDGLEIIGGDEPSQAVSEPTTPLSPGLQQTAPESTLLSVLSNLGKANLSSEVQQTVIKATLVEVGLGPSNESMEGLGRWLQDVQQHIANIPPMPRADLPDFMAMVSKGEAQTAAIANAKAKAS
eukprot:TRINITY_DN106801_c0_g1_i1.p1 TRINITY_DN106801_c0_g1~~TRINITY_DN106801_c0_g1_i1.p1  ORF type:complete len:535 (-),score=88.98 TRINITY_DN106801_c0_g1_i1:73-1647(-)